MLLQEIITISHFNWFLLILHIILGILHISLFEDNWLVRTWMVLIPYLIEAILITTVWEWIFNIWVIEKRIELMGVLGRRISIDDVLSIQLLRGNNTRKGENFTKMGHPVTQAVFMAGVVRGSQWPSSRIGL